MTDTPLPTATLKAVYATVFPPKLLGFDVIVDGVAIAALSREEVMEQAKKVKTGPSI